MRKKQASGNSEIDRYLIVLEALAVAPNYQTVKNIRHTLEQQGHEVTERTVQRMLNHFRDRYGLQSRTKPGKTGKPPLEWAWPKETGAPSFQPMDPPTALTFQLATELLAPIVPGPFLEAMERDLRRAGKVLAQTDPKAKTLPKKLRVIPRGQGRLPATIDPAVLNAVFEATLAEKQIKVRYSAQAVDPPSRAEHVLNPLGLVFRFDTFYLVHVREPQKDGQDPDQVMEWPLHRFLRVEPLRTRARAPAGFDLDSHLQQPGFLQNNFLKKVAQLGPTVRLELLFEERTARYVRERPFSEDQQAHFQDDGRVLVKATVGNTREMLTELLNFADDVEVLKPKALRDYFADVAAKLAYRYAGPAARQP